MAVSTASKDGNVGNILGCVYCVGCMGVQMCMCVDTHAYMSVCIWRSEAFLDYFLSCLPHWGSSLVRVGGL